MNIPEAELEFLDEFRRKHPERKTAYGALLAEVLTGQDMAERSHAAHILMCLGCRRGIKPLERLIGELLPSTETSMQGTSPERGLLSSILFAIGRMDTEQSHGLLVRLLRESKNPIVRADVLEAMAYEKPERLELDLILPFLSYQEDYPEILSALYAIQYSGYVNKRPADSRKRILPLLKHPYPMVRMFAIGVLAFRPANRGHILQLANDPDQQVRAAVQEAINLMEMLQEET